MKTVAAQVLDPTHLELSEPLELDSGVKISVIIRDDGTTNKATGKSAPPKTLRFREREHAWRRTHGEVLRKLEGQWVVLEGEEIIAHGEDPADLVEQARRRGIASPYVFYVEPRPPGVVKIGL